MRHTQLRAFDAQARAAFIVELRKRLAADFKHMLPSFPASVQDRIVANMAGRAARWGVDWQSSVHVFCELMMSVSGDFDDDADVRDILYHTERDVNEVVKELPYSIPEASWRRIGANALDLPFFTPSELIGAPLVRRVEAAIPIALHDLAAKSDPSVLARDSCGLAGKLGMADSEDAPLVLAACGLLYGADFHRPKNLAWTGDVFRPENDGRKKVAMLKLRIGIDHGRYV